MIQVSILLKSDTYQLDYMSVQYRFWLTLYFHHF